MVCVAGTPEHEAQQRLRAGECGDRAREEDRGDVQAPYDPPRQGVSSKKKKKKLLPCRAPEWVCSFFPTLMRVLGWTGMRVGVECWLGSDITHLFSCYLDFSLVSSCCCVFCRYIPHACMCEVLYLPSLLLRAPRSPLSTGPLLTPSDVRLMNKN